MTAAQKKALRAEFDSVSSAWDDFCTEFRTLVEGLIEDRDELLSKLDELDNPDTKRGEALQERIDAFDFLEDIDLDAPKSEDFEAVREYVEGLA